MRQVKSLVGLVLALMLINSSVSYAQKDLPLNPGVKDALYLIDTEQPTKAIAELEKAVAANPADASLLYYLGYGQLKAGDRAKALASFDKGAALDEKVALNFVGKGYLNMLEKKPADAKANFDKALALSKSKSVAVLKGIAEAYDLDNKYSVESVALLNKAKGINDQDPEIAILLGDTHLIQNTSGNVGPAVSNYENALLCKAADPKSKARMDAKAHYKIGMAYEKAKNNEVALESFQKAVKSEVDYTSAYRELGQLYYLNKEATKAVEAYQKYLSLTERPEDPQVQYEYAFFLFMAKDYPKANATFEKVVNGKDPKAFVYRFYAKSLYESGEYEKSKAMGEKYLQIAKPEEIEAKDYADIGNTIQKLNPTDTAALGYYQKSIDLNKDQPDLLQRMSTIGYKLKRFDIAISAYKQLIKSRKTPNAQDYYSIGRAYYSNNQFQQADSSFTKFIEMQPDIALGYFWEARTQSTFDPENDKGLAKPYFEKFLEKATADKNKNEMIEAYGYLGYYNYLKKDVPAAKAAYQKVLELNPAEPNAKAALDQLNNIGKPKPAKKAP